jgi:hypothetical protein
MAVQSTFGLFMVLCDKHIIHSLVQDPVVSAIRAGPQRSGDGHSVGRSVTSIQADRDPET